MSKVTEISLEEEVQTNPEQQMPLLSGRVARAQKRGYVVSGWTVMDYVRHAVDKRGWEVAIIHGIKGTLKSNLLMQLMFHYYQDWEAVLKHVIMQPIDYVNCWGEGEIHRVPCLGHDDISAHFPSHLYNINRELYHTFSKDWALIRPHLNVFICTAPHKHRIVPLVVEEMTSEIVTNMNNTYDHQRWAWDISLKDYRKETARPIMCETDQPIKMENVPYSIFKRYWERRLELSRSAHRDFLAIMKDLQGSLQTASARYVEGELPKEIMDMTSNELRHLGGALMRRVGRNMGDVEVHNTVMGILREMRRIDTTPEQQSQQPQPEGQPTSST